MIQCDKTRIKNEIGQAFLDLLKYVSYKKILKKESTDRSPWENHLLVNLLKKQPYFQKKEVKLTDSQLQTITHLMTIHEYNAGESIYEFGEIKKRYLTIIRGKVQLIQKNKDGGIRNWQWALNAY